MNTQVSNSDKSLLQILVEELKEWPLVCDEEAEVIVQDGDTNLITYIKGDMEFLEDYDEWYWETWTSGDYFIKIECATLASDYQTAKITKEMWEEEKKKMESKEFTKSNFTKDDLKVGMVMTTRGGLLLIIVDHNRAVVHDESGFIELDVRWLGNYNDGLYYPSYSVHDIMKVTYGGEVVFIREEKTEQEQAIEKAEEELAKIKENAKALEESIKKLKESV